MKIARRIVVTLAGLLALLALIALFLPERVTISRSLSMDAYPATVFALANDFRNINRWSPKADPDTVGIEYTFSGPERGEGAAMRWESQTPQTGYGRQLITRSVPYERIETKLEFEGQGTATTAFELSAEKDSTTVVWSYSTSFGYDLAGRYLGLFYDDWIGRELEAGLVRLRSLAEDLPATDFGDLDAQFVQTESVTIASTPATTEAGAAAISRALAGAFFDVIRYMQQNGLTQAGPPIAIQRGFDGQLRIEAGIPVSGDLPDPGDAAAPVRLTSTYAGKAVKAQHIGPYRRLSQTHDRVLAYIAALGLRRNGDPWEEYVSDPGRVAEAELVTNIYYPVE